MEYSVQAYIKKQSTEVLERFLQQCSLSDGTDNYDHIIPDSPYNTIAACSSNPNFAL